jgi:hypothetical protein
VTLIKHGYIKVGLGGCQEKVKDQKLKIKMTDKNVKKEVRRPGGNIILSDAP